jgi:chitin synthase
MALSTTLFKYGLIALIIVLDAIVATLIFLYGEYYWYLPIIAMGNTYKVLLIIFGVVFQIFKRIKRLCRKKRDISKSLPRGTTVGFLMPCYSEDETRLENTMKSLKDTIRVSVEQYGINPIIFVVADGKCRGQFNEFPTYKYLNKMLDTKNQLTLVYNSWKNERVIVDVSYGLYHNIKYMLFVKEKNQSKKDSLIMVRKIIKCLNENNLPAKEVEDMPILANQNKSFNKRIVNILKDEMKITSIDYLFGTDAGTIMDKFTVSRLLKSISKHEKIMGVSGFVRADTYEPQTKYKWLVIYQSFEYIIQQVITRAGQSIFRHVTCLPGCVQIFRMHDHCIGDILNKFEALPSNNILSKIRAYLGEDRRYTCLIQYAHPDARMKMNTHANVYTDVPDTWSVFLSQRRRWFLSSNANNITDIMSSSMPLFIRFIAFAQIWGALFILTNTVCFARFIMFIVQGRSLVVIMSMLSVYLFINAYKILVALIYSDSLGDFVYSILSILIFIVMSIPVNLAVMFYAIATMDDFSWGKTQRVNKNDQREATRLQMGPANLENGNVEQVQPLAEIDNETAVIKYIKVESPCVSDTKIRIEIIDDLSEIEKPLVDEYESDSDNSLVDVVVHVV